MFSSKSNNNRLTTTTRIVVDDVVVVVILLHAFWFDFVAINNNYIEHTTDYVSILCYHIFYNFCFSCPVRITFSFYHLHIYHNISVVLAFGINIIFCKSDTFFRAVECLT